MKDWRNWIALISSGSSTGIQMSSLCWRALKKCRWKMVIWCWFGSWGRFRGAVGIWRDWKKRRSPFVWGSSISHGHKSLGGVRIIAKWRKLVLAESYGETTKTLLAFLKSGCLGGVWDCTARIEVLPFFESERRKYKLDIFVFFF